MTDPIADALRTALAAADGEEATPLRLHLASLLATDPSTAAEAFELARTVLTDAPGDLDALELGAKACRALGQSSRAERYERALEGLSEAARTPAEIVPLRVVPHETDHEGVADVETPAITLEQVAGMDAVKRRLHLSFLGPLRHPELRKMYGKSLKGGLLLFGPPGCGKTFIARAVAGELGAKFIEIGLNDVLDLYVGQSERNLHQRFELARRSAPCVLFIDEIDALGQKRSHQRGGAGRNVVAQLLSEMDGVSAANDGVFVLGATNHPWDVDAALRRPGRFDRMLLVLPPDLTARTAILRRALSDRPVESLDFAALAGRTGGFSGADLVHLADSATEMALADSIETGHARRITATDLERALLEVKPSTEAWLQMARNYAEFGGDAGTYDDLMAYLRSVDRAR